MIHNNSLMVGKVWMPPCIFGNLKKVILESKTILVERPCRRFRILTSLNGTGEIAKYVAEATKNGAYSLVGGGDSLLQLTSRTLQIRFLHVSTRWWCKCLRQSKENSSWSCCNWRIIKNYIQIILDLSNLKWTSKLDDNFRGFIHQ